MHVFLCFFFFTPLSQTGTSHIFLGYWTKVSYSLLLRIFCFKFLLELISWPIIFVLKCTFCWISSLSSDDPIFYTRESLLIMNPLCFIGVLASFFSIFRYQSLWSLSPEVCVCPPLLGVLGYISIRNHQSEFQKHGSQS